MKKLKILFLIIVMLVLVPVYCNAVSVNIEIVPSSSNININSSTEVTLKLHLSKADAITEGMPLGFTTTLNYDRSIFELESVQGLNNWTVTHNTENDMLLGNVTNVVTDVDIAEIKLKINSDNITKETQSTVKLDNLSVSDGDYEINVEASSTINITNVLNEDENNGNNNNGNNTENAPNEDESDDVQQVDEIEDVTTVPGEDTERTTAQGSNPTQNTGTSNSEDENLASGILPKAGNSIFILYALVIVGILAIIFKFKSRKIKY